MSENRRLQFATLFFCLLNAHSVKIRLMKTKILPRYLTESRFVCEFLNEGDIIGGGVFVERERIIDEAANCALIARLRSRRQTF